jgi:type IV secretion system protein VirB10
MSDGSIGGVPRDIDDESSIVSGSPRRPLSNGQKIGVAGLVLVVMLAFIWIGQLNKATQTKDQPAVPFSGGGSFRAAPPDPPPVVTPASLPMPPAMPAPSMFAPPGPSGMTPAESPIFAFSGGGGGSQAAVADAAGAAASLAISQDAQPPAPPSALGNLLKPTVLSGTKARLLPHPDMMVTMGTIIPCTLQTAIDSQLAGFVKCVLPQDVRSTTGNVVLLDRGTTVVGEIGRGLVQGQDRVFVLWDRAETPDHAIIELSSPGTDELGRSGLPGTVNNHWWQRFGGAIMLSVIDGGLQAGTALAANSGQAGGTFFNSFQSNGANVSDTALQATIDIPPTLEKNQGDNVAIFVAKDLDFSDVYALRVNGAADAQ